VTTKKRLTKEQQRAIDDALDELEEAEKRALLKHGAAAALAADAAAQQEIAGAVAWHLANTAALRLLDGYRAELDRGGSMCTVQRPDGTTAREFVPWLNDADRATREKVADIIAEHLEAGGTLGRIEGSQGYQRGSLADKLSAVFSERKSHAATVARTEMSRIRNDAAWNRYKEAGVGKVKIIGPDDDLTCDDCGLVVGEVYDIDEAPYIPGHPNCRHGISPVVGGEA
jgi:SPP1 gp7 family putative phage head morphogenesis protein